VEVAKNISNVVVKVDLREEFLPNHL